jgi:hypothetical protein
MWKLGASLKKELLFLLAIVLSVLLRYTDSDCPFGIFKLFLISNDKTASLIIL